MEIFQAEIKAGLKDILSNPANASIKYDTPIAGVKFNKVRELYKKLMASKPSKALASLTDDELYLLNSVMVSVGWNKNDDVFLKNEIWANRHTPEDKPLNIGHNELDIVGHIVGNCVVDENGDLIDDDTLFEELPDTFHIVANSVMYKVWSDETQAKKVTDIINQIEFAFATGKDEDMKWYVSMECLFAGFDYAVMSEDGAVAIIPRTEQSAFLTSCLRSYGGTGKFGEYRIGRAIKNLSFSGLGIVEKPANPSSIIFNGVLSFRGTTTSTLNEVMEKIMANDNNELVSELRKQIETLTANTKTLETKITELEKKVSDGDLSFKVVSDKKDSLEAQITALETEKKDLSEKLVEAAAKLTEAEKSLADIKAAQITTARTKVLLDKGLSQEDAEANVVKFAGLNDETFNAIASLIQVTKVVAEEVKPVVKPEEAAQAAEKLLEEAKKKEADEAARAAAALANQDIEKEKVNKTKADLAEFIKAEVIEKNKKKAKK